MWMAKIPIIMYVFAIALTFSGVYIDEVFGENLFQTFTYEALGDLVAGHNIENESISIDLIFGDFIKVAQVILGILSGDFIAGAFSSLPYFSATWQIGIMAIFTLGSALMWGYLISGRTL